jgi:hypothetical protein
VRVIRPAPDVRHGAAELARANHVLLAFVQSAVIRRHLGLSYRLVTPALRQGFTRRRWETGAIPVVPFPAGTDFRGAVLVGSLRNKLEYKVSLFPPKASKQPPALFDLTLRRIGGAWLVDSWAPSMRGLYGPNAIPDGPPTGNEPVIKPTNPHLASRWAYAPIVVVALIVLLGPLALGGRMLKDSRRARAVRRSMSL